MFKIEKLIIEMAQFPDKVIGIKDIRALISTKLRKDSRSS